LPAATTEAARRKARRGPAPFSSAELKSGIHKISDHRFQLDRTLVERARERLFDIASTSRFKPARARGRFVGLRVVEMRRKGLLSSLGLRRGDILRTINGQPVADTDALLATYVGVLGSSRITLALERDRRPLTLQYVIR
jgi:general secretion pathway protein C